MHERPRKTDHSCLKEHDVGLTMRQSCLHLSSRVQHILQVLGEMPAVHPQPRRDGQFRKWRRLSDPTSFSCVPDCQMLRSRLCQIHASNTPTTNASVACSGTDGTVLLCEGASDSCGGRKGSATAFLLSTSLSHVCWHLPPRFHRHTPWSVVNLHGGEAPQRIRTVLERCAIEWRTAPNSALYQGVLFAAYNSGARTTADGGRVSLRPVLLLQPRRRHCDGDEYSERPNNLHISCLPYRQPQAGLGPAQSPRCITSH